MISMKKDKFLEMLLQDIAPVMQAIVCSKDGDFRTLFIEIAKLDPKEDFRFSDLSGVDFGCANLDGFDFTGADLSNADLRLASIDGAVFADVSSEGTLWPEQSDVHEREQPQ